jgi:hypothetical protein
MKVRRESVQTRSETGTRKREALRHTRAVCRRAERRDCPSQPRIHACSRSFMNNAGSSDVRRSRNRVVVHIMIYDVSATRTDALLKQDGRDDRRVEVRSSRFSELRTQNFELRIAPDALHPTSLRGPCAKNVVYQLYIQLLAQYNSEVLHSCCREGYVCVDRLGLSRQEPPLPISSHAPRMHRV